MFILKWLLVSRLLCAMAVATLLLSMGHATADMDQLKADIPGIVLPSDTVIRRFHCDDAMFDAVSCYELEMSRDGVFTLQTEFARLPRPPGNEDKSAYAKQKVDWWPRNGDTETYLIENGDVFSRFASQCGATKEKGSFS